MPARLVDTNSPGDPSSSSHPINGRWKRGLLFVSVFALFASLAWLGWFYWRWSRPGMRHYLKGIDYAAAGHPDQAEAEWILGVKQDPTDYRCYEQLGDYYSSLNRLADAAACYGSAVKLHPTEESLFLRLARTHQSLGDYKGAARAAYRAAALKPDDPNALGLYGILEAKIKERRTAIAALTRACSLAPGNASFLMAKALAEMDALDLPAAEADLRDYLKRHPGDPEASYYLGILYNQKPHTPQNIQAAIGYARATVSGRPDDLRGYTALGQLYLDSRQPKLALQTFLQGRRLAPNDEAVLHGLADSYGTLGMAAEKAAVDRYLQQVLARHNDIEHLKHVMGFNHFDMKDGLRLAQLEDQDGNVRLAVTYYEQLIREFPKNMRPRRMIAALYARIGQPALAKTALRTDMVP